MKKTQKKYLLILLFIISIPIQANNNVREKININRDWKFSLSDITNAEKYIFDDTQWDNINLPHSFSIPYFMWYKVYNGYGWYRKNINIPEQWKDKNVTLEFEGSFLETEIFLNGEFIGKHTGGYTGFFFDITNHLKQGDNILAVRVNNLWKPDVAPRAGDHQFSGGIYRDVYLNITDKLHVDLYGTFIKTLSVDNDKANCEIEIEIKNNYSCKKDIVVLTEIISPNGKKISTDKTTKSIDADKISFIKQVLPVIKKPKLWSPETPHLYNAITKIYLDKNLIDTYQTTFGIRSFRWCADEGFFLNDKHYYLFGANVHQDQAGWGDAVTNGAIRRDVQLMKDAGFNCIRGSHYPHDPAFIQACDEIGLIFFSENAFWGTGGAYGDRFSWTPPTSSGYPNNPLYRDNFDKSVLTQLKEMIKIHRNNASVAAWSMSNEPFFSDWETFTSMKNLLNTAVDSARKWDPTREPAIGGAQRGNIDKLGKNAIAFYNGDGASRDEFQNPGVPNLVSEYGSTTADRPGPFIAGWRDLNQTPGYEDPFNPPAWRSGQIIWCGFDHGTIFGKGMATMGMVDYFRIPKKQYYWYVERLVKGVKSPVEPQWPVSGIPFGLKIETSDIVISSTDGTDDIWMQIGVIDESGQYINNNVNIELSVISGPGEFPTGRKIKFTPPSDDDASDIAIRDGKAAITFRSYHGGKSLIKATSDGLKPAIIEITTKGLPMWIEGQSKPVPDRPYKRFEDDIVGYNSNPDEMLLATNRPTWSSSALEGTNKANVNDGDINTLWKPNIDDKDKWWKLALEASYNISRINISLPKDEVCYIYKIEVSSDDEKWTEIITDRVSEKDSKSRDLRGELGKNISFIRISFQSDAAGLCEIKVGGETY